MTHWLGGTGPAGSLSAAEAAELLPPRAAEVYTTAAAFYVACLKNGYVDEAQEFAEWFLEEFDLDLET